MIESLSFITSYVQDCEHYIGFYDLMSIIYFIIEPKGKCEYENLGWPCMEYSAI